jgi:RNA-directed DNA polymerase
VSEPKPKDKPFEISRWLVWEAYQRVKANDGAAGVDGGSIEEFERDLKGNLYKLWNRLSSGSYFPAPVRAVEIPKAHGQGVRILGVPTVADRIAQTVVRLYLEPKVEPLFHPDSYGYRPERSALQAVGVCRDAGLLRRRLHRRLYLRKSRRPDAHHRGAAQHQAAIRWSRCSNTTARTT